MRAEDVLSVGPEVRAALDARRPVVALESTLITHGLPWPVNLETARAAERAVRQAGAVPATVAVLGGRVFVGLDEGQVESLARATEDGRPVLKASRRDLAAAIARRATASTTVAATMALAHRAGIAVFATGGIGGAHRPPAPPSDVSADLFELARTPVLVVCAGAKSILDLPRTLDLLETFGVPVVGYRTDTFPAFYVRSSSEPVSARADSPEEAAELFAAHRSLGGGGVLLAQPVAEDVALPADEFAAALANAERDAEAAGARGPELTPFLLRRLAEITGGRSLTANRALIEANAALAAEVAFAVCGLA
jgi:pseudouridine-5'-phosphate glycosidase